MAAIPIALVGIDHPHAAQWRTVLRNVPELMPVAHYDPCPGSAKATIESPYNQIPLYGDLVELLHTHPVQAALVMLPLDQAESALLTLARSGVHILAEKPVARTGSALLPVIEALDPTTVFYAGYCWRFHPIIEQVRDLIQQGILGDLWSIEMRWLTSQVGHAPDIPAHRSPDSYLFRRQVSRGGMLQWLGCHFLDVMLYLTQQPVHRVMAMTSRQTTDELEVEDTATCLLRFDNEMLGSLHVGYVLPFGGQMFLGIRGSLGWVHWDVLQGRQLTVHSEHPAWIASPTRTYQFPEPPQSSYAGNTGELMLRDFVRCIGQNGADPAFTVKETLSVLKVLDAAYESASSGHQVSVPT